MPVSDNFLFDPVQKFGRIPDIDGGNTNEDVWDGEGAYPFPTVPVAMTVSSDSAEDTATTGTGARSVEVYTLDVNGVESEVVYDMAGLTPVSIPGDQYRVYRAYVITPGSHGTNVGTIYVGSGVVTNGVPDVVYAQIQPDVGQTLMAVYTIPVQSSGGQEYTSGQIVRWYANCGAVQAAYATIALQTRDPGRAWRSRRTHSISEGGPMDEEVRFGINLKPMTDIRARVIINGVNNTSIAAGFDIKLRQKV